MRTGLIAIDGRGPVLVVALWTRACLRCMESPVSRAKSKHSITPLLTRCQQSWSQLHKRLGDIQGYVIGQPILILKHSEFAEIRSKDKMKLTNQKACRVVECSTALQDRNLWNRVE